MAGPQRCSSWTYEQALIGDECGYEPLTDLSLIYTDLITGSDVAVAGVNRRDDGFAMGFRAHILKWNIPQHRLPADGQGNRAPRWRRPTARP